MKYQVRDGGKYQKIIEAEISAEEMKPVYENLRVRLHEKVKAVEFQGETQHEPDQSDILQELADDLLPSVYERGLRESGLEAVTQPTVEITQPAFFNPLVCRFTITVKPQVKLGQYKGVKTQRVFYTVADREIEEEWVKRHGRAEKTTLSEAPQDLSRLEEEIRIDLTKKKRELADREARSNALIEVIKSSEIDVPPVMFELETNRMVEELQQYLSLLGQSLEQYLEYTGETLEVLRKNDRERSEIMVRRELVLEEIVRQENIEATQEDIEAAITELATQYEMRTNKVRQTVLQHYDMSELTHRTKIGKALDLVCSSAVIVDEAQIDNE